jgi:hypothetical protein
MEVLSGRLSHRPVKLAVLPLEQEIEDRKQEIGSKHK